MKKKITVVFKEPGKAAVVKRLPNTLEALQDAVGGYIETLTVATDLVVIVNEEGRLKGLPYCCKVCGRVLVGPVILAGVQGDEFDDVPSAILKVDDIRRLEWISPDLFSGGGD